MTALPRSDNPLLIRTDFTNDAAWKGLVSALETPSQDGFLANLTFVDDRSFDSADPADLTAKAAADSDHAILFLADATTMAHPEHPVSCIDLIGSNRAFRAVPAELWGVENNLSLANMDFEEFAEAVQDDGIFRGY